MTLFTDLAAQVPGMIAFEVRMTHAQKLKAPERQRGAKLLAAGESQAEV